MTLQVHTPFNDAEGRLSYARQVIRAEADALHVVADRLDESFLQAVDLLAHCPGRVAITGTGKSADVGQKLAGTLNSTGTRAYLLDATRAVHGDLGMVHPHDVALVLSHSGESEEIVRLLGPMRQLALALIGLTGNPHSTLARQADVAVVYGPLQEACPLGLAPSTSTTAMIAIGDALAFVLSRMRQFSHEDFARFHPAGSLGRKLLKVEAVMRRGADLRLASEDETVRAVFSRAARRGRRTGAVMLVDAQGRLSGLFTDSDLARLFEQRRDHALDRPIREVMTTNPITVPHGTRLNDALDILRRCKISELPIVDGLGRPVGLLDITDLIGLVSAEEIEPLARVA
ncbi:MAG: KpsF/GutQ family sugar-phosphate isomerase [Gemmataceae bacterium]|nr:KpsF/GutQ family sugar-phosphate isomerase [Gemmataceae bacterium]MDW8266731.1 KpsF/GutQ family sugar-phosphate isomerase [Gemmataceae bacterium]